MLYPCFPWTDTFCFAGEKKIKPRITGKHSCVWEGGGGGGGEESGAKPVVSHISLSGFLETLLSALPPELQGAER